MSSKTLNVEKVPISLDRSSSQSEVATFSKSMPAFSMKKFASVAKTSRLLYMSSKIKDMEVVGRTLDRVLI